MNEDYQNNVDIEEEERPIDWAKYISTGIKYWKKIALVTFVFAVLSVVVALRQKRIYTVSVTLAPEVQNSGSRSVSSLASIAGRFGVNLGIGNSAVASDALNITIFPEIANSTPFLVQLFEVELSAKPELPKDKIEARRIMDGPLPTEKLYDYLTGKNREKGFLAKILESIFGPAEEDPNYLDVNISRLTKEQSRVLKALRNMISVDVDKKTAMTTISVKMDDPLMCTQLADTICLRLREYVFKYRTEKEQQNYDFYEALCDSTYNKMVAAQTAYAECVDNNRSVVLQKVTARTMRLQQEANMAEQIYQQAVQQREISRTQLQQMKPVFAVVEPATMPQSASNSRKKTCMVITFFGFVVSCAWYVFGKEWLKTNYAEIKAKIKDAEI